MFCFLFFQIFKENIFLPPLPKVKWPNFLDFWNNWGKVMERSGLRIKTLTHKGCQIGVHKKVCFLVIFVLLSRTFSVSVLLSA